MAKSGAGLAIVLGLLLIFSGIVDESSSNVQEQTTQCNDGIDNDGDGFIDIDDNECQLHIYDPQSQSLIDMNCPLWNDETNPPLSVEQCNGGV